MMSKSPDSVSAPVVHAAPTTVVELAGVEVVGDDRVVVGVDALVLGRDADGDALRAFAERRRQRHADLGDRDADDARLRLQRRQLARVAQRVDVRRIDVDEGLQVGVGLRVQGEAELARGHGQHAADAERRRHLPVVERRQPVRQQVAIGLRAAAGLLQPVVLVGDRLDVVDEAVLVVCGGADRRQDQAEGVVRAAARQQRRVGPAGGQIVGRGRADAAHAGVAGFVVLGGGGAGEDQRGQVEPGSGVSHGGVRAASARRGLRRRPAGTDLGAVAAAVPARRRQAAAQPAAAARAAALRPAAPGRCRGAGQGRAPAAPITLCAPGNRARAT
jgi:hypothetical protein